MLPCAPMACSTWQAGQAFMETVSTEPRLKAREKQFKIQSKLNHCFTFPQCRVSLIIILYCMYLELNLQSPVDGSMCTICPWLYAQLEIFILVAFSLLCETEADENGFGAARWFPMDKLWMKFHQVFCAAQLHIQYNTRLATSLIYV